MSFYYSKRDKTTLENFLVGKDFLFDTSRFKSIENRMYYEGYVRLCDEGYYKTIYVNIFIPHDGDTDKPIYLSE